MNRINLVALATIVILMFGYIKNIQYSTYFVKTNRKESYGYLPVVLLLGFTFVIRVILAGKYNGHETDINCFLGWSDMLVKNGFSGFYSKEVFTDYPPGYMYVLYIIGVLRNLFHFEYFSTPSIILLKLPAILCDMVLGYLIYKTAGKKLNQSSALTCATVYLLNPAIIINSAVWGQVDSVFTLAVVLMCYFVVNKRLPIAYFAFAIGILIKPQTLIFTPVLLFAIYDGVFKNKFDKQQFFYQLKWGVLAIVTMILLILPFGFGKVLTQYKDTLTSYPYASANAYNIWTMFGLNWSSQENKFLFLTYAGWGRVAIMLIVLFALYISIRAKSDQSKYTMIASVIVSSMFLFSVRMHERYMFPVLALLILTFVLKPRRETYLVYVLFSVAHFYNVAHVLFEYDYQNFNPKELFPIIIAIFTLISFGIFIYSIIINYLHQKTELAETEDLLLIDTPEKVEEKLKLKEECSKIKESEIPVKLVKFDLIAILLIVILYSAVAFYDLGDKSIPETAWTSDHKEDSIIIDMGKDVQINKISYFNGYYERRDYSLSVAEESDGPWSYLQEVRFDPVFYWGEEEINTNTRFLRITTKTDKSAIFELVLLDEDGNILEPVNSSEYPALFDEQNLHPERTTFRNSTYFDEIYHARTAYEYLHGLYSYENTHPPLGKIFISLGMIFFGVNPFGWRIIGTLFGIGMLPFIYAFSKRFFRESWIAVLVTVLFAFDFMHFTQTRIATIDVYVTFFIILMYYFMYQYTRLSFYDTDLKKTWIPLGLCGISMGLGIASKWTGVYAGAGLCILFFWNLYRRFLEYRIARKDPEGITGGISHESIIKTFKSKTVKTLAFCIIFFIIIPAVIYLLSYIPFVDSQGRGLIERMLKNQQSMFNYHSTVDATHPYSSWWYQWPTMYRPIWYYSGHVTDKISEGISAFGNPLVWWAGIPAFFYMIYLTVKKKDTKAFFLSIGYLAQYMPWILVTRITFIYHYFPSVPFVTLMVGYSMYQIVSGKPKMKKFAIGYTIAAVILFAMFYPVLSGQPVNKDYVSYFLRWFNSWVLVS